MEKGEHVGDVARKVGSGRRRDTESHWKTSGFYSEMENHRRMSLWLPGKQTLEWRFMCQKFLGECSWIELLRKRKDTSRAGESGATVQFQRRPQPTSSKF